MIYFFLAVLGYVLLAIVNILDKFILTKKLPKPAVYVFFSTVFLILLFSLVPFGAGFLDSGFDYLIAGLAGFAFMSAVWLMYTGFCQSEISHAGPMIGSAVAMFVFLLSSLFLREQLSLLQIFGVLVLVAGSLMISFEKSRLHTGWHKGIFWLIGGGLMFAISHVASKYIYDGYGFFTGLVWTRGFVGFFGLCLLFYPPVFRALFGARQTKSQTSWQQFGLVFFNQFMAVTATVLIQLAIALGSVIIVNALAGIQYAFLVVAVWLVTKFHPKLFAEKFTRGEFRNELISVLIISSGLVLLLI
ncbi:MAG: hypothetical protein COU31_04650 [Candidatus Magasanikbacteria bacterium CG10_big_fil_rev_8_21_14_0_10_40_10]|uniref:EamA domain-containing protein n=1 Tax=Candidatus Magasanikbacteria bacterium CG10_big_fil_rev_8_21_14_0_10_40_10 TaxID=1974648 RepID=A0A2M6W2X1_9BACT|nr:MAG: hypothetical protein COU31_04650 [Candidatus Magasanikbacteria bacterium CG10_big_fil_rev_8_21_14_0_10_40_10]